jgi:hypothetical protein
MTAYPITFGSACAFIIPEWNIPQLSAGMVLIVTEAIYQWKIKNRINANSRR